MCSQHVATHIVTIHRFSDLERNHCDYSTVQYITKQACPPKLSQGSRSSLDDLVFWVLGVFTLFSQLFANTPLDTVQYSMYSTARWCRYMLQHTSRIQCNTVQYPETFHWNSVINDALTHAFDPQCQCIESTATYIQYHTVRTVYSNLQYTVHSGGSCLVSAPENIENTGSCNHQQTKKRTVYTVQYTIAFHLATV